MPPKEAEWNPLTQLLSWKLDLGIRTHALHTLQKQSRTSPPHWLVNCVKRLLPLLLTEKHTSLRSSLSEAIGAWTAQLACACANGKVGAADSLQLFSWAEQKLGIKDAAGNTPAAVSPLPYHTQLTLLSALHTALKAAPRDTCPRATTWLLNRLLPICLHLLEFPTTGSSLVPALVQTMRSCIHCDQVFLKGGFSTYPYPLSASPVHLRFTDVVDLLVGWSLDEAVPSAVRQQLQRLFHELRPYWPGHQEFTTGLMSSMVEDVRTASGTMLLLLLPVLCSVVGSCAPSISQGWAVLPSLLHALRQAAEGVSCNSSEQQTAPVGEGSPVITGICEAVQHMMLGLHEAMQGRSRTMQIPDHLARCVLRPCLHAPSPAPRPDLLPEVHALVSSVFECLSPPPTCLLCPLAPPSHQVVTTDLVAWACGGASELLLSLLHTHPGSEPPVLQAISAVLKIVASCGEQKCEQLVGDGRLLGRMGMADADKAGTEAVAVHGVWGLRLSGQAQVKEAVSGLLMELFNVPALTAGLYQQLHSELVWLLKPQSLEQQQEQQERSVNVLGLHAPAATKQQEEEAVLLVFDLEVLEQASKHGRLLLPQLAELECFCCSAAQHFDAVHQQQQKQQQQEQCDDKDNEDGALSVDLWGQWLNRAGLPARLGEEALVKVLKLWAAVRNESSMQGSELADEHAVLQSCLSACPDSEAVGLAVLSLLEQHLGTVLHTQPAVNVPLTPHPLPTQQLLNALDHCSDHASPAVRAATMEACFRALSPALQLPSSSAPYSASNEPAAASTSPSSDSEAAHAISAEAYPTTSQVAPAATPLHTLPYPLLIQLSGLAIRKAADVEGTVASAAMQLALALSPVPLSATMLPRFDGLTTSISDSTPHLQQRLLGSPAWHDQLSLQPPTLSSFRPPHLSQLFDLLFQEQPSVVTPTLTSGVLLRKREEPKQSAIQDDTSAQDTDTSLPLLQRVAQLTAGCDSGDSGCQTFADAQLAHSSSQLAWLGLQEGARHCVAARMRTHLGGPTQSFNALEIMLAGLVAKAASERAAVRAQGHGFGSTSSPSQPHFFTQAPPTHRSHEQQQQQEQQQPPSKSSQSPKAPPTPALESAWMALEYVGALERGVRHACEGIHSRQAQPSAVLAFFKANKKVCEGWFTRVRHLLLRLSSLCGDHHAAIHHGWLRLTDLKTHLNPLLAQLSGAAESPAAPGGVGSAKGTASAAASKDPVAASTQAGLPVGTLLAGLVEALRITAEGMLACQEPEALVGLHAWASKAFAPLLHPQAPKPQQPQSQHQIEEQQASAKKQQQQRQKQRKMQRLHEQQQEVVAAMREELEDEEAGRAEGHTEQGESIISQEDTSDQSHSTSSSQHSQHSQPKAVVPSPSVLKPPPRGIYSPLLGPIPAPTPSSSSAAPAQSARPSSHSLPDPLIWILGMAAETQGKYEHALHAYNTFLRQQSQAQLVHHSSKPPATGAAPSTAQSATPPAASQTPYQQQQQRSGARPHALLSPVLLALQPTVVQRAAACYSAVADWSRFHVFMSAQHARAQQDPGLASWWGPCTHSPEMQAVLALANFDTSEEMGPSDEAARLDQGQSSVMSGLWATKAKIDSTLSSSAEHTPSTKVRHKGSTGTASTSMAPRTNGSHKHSSSDHTNDALAHMCGVFREAATQGLHTFMRSNLLHLYCVAHLQAYSTTDAPPSHLNATRLRSILSSTPLCSMLRCTTSSTLPLLPAQQPGNSAASTGCLSIGSLALLPSIHASPKLVSDILSPTADVSVLTRLMRVQAATDPACAMSESRSLLLSTALAARSTGNTDLCVRTLDKLALLPDVTASPAMFAAAAVARLSVQGEAGLMPPAEVARRATEALLPLITQPEQLHSIAVTAASSSIGPTHSSSQQQAEGTVFGCPSAEAAAVNLAAAFLSLSAWMGKGAAATAAAGSGTSHPSDFTAPNWQPLLDFLRTSAQPTSPRDVHASAAISQRSSLHHRPEVPSVASLRPGEVATCLAGLHCAPCLPLAWLQWGTALLQWAREASRPSGGAGSKGAGSVEHLEASSAGAHALCRYLGLAASQQEIGQPEDAMPCLVRILQVVSKHGQALEHQLTNHLQLCPPRVWQAITPQLFAQLHHPQAGVRRLVLRLLQLVGAAAPFAVLYTALAEAQVAEHSGTTLLPELQALLQGLDAGRPRLMADVRRLMTEAERLTVTWEERWHALLGELEVDVARRCVTLRAEAERVAGGPLRGGAKNAEGDDQAGQPSSGRGKQKKGGGAEEAQRFPPLIANRNAIGGKLKLPLKGVRGREEAADPELEAKRKAAAEQRQAILANRYATLMLPIVLVLEKNAKANAASEPETPAEACFMAEVLPRLSNAIASFKNPSAEAMSCLSSRPQVCWEPLKAILRLLSSTLDRSTVMSLGHVSPGLAAFAHTRVPMPGLSSSSGASFNDLTPEDGREDPDDGKELSGSSTAGTVTIAGVFPTLFALPTKTRPKRLELLGSDGAKYVFLLKGRDDLRMDERLMQVVQLSNSLLRADKHASRLGLGMRHYSVTPLGDRVGLIQWVHHTTSIYALFRGWQSNMRSRYAATAAAAAAAPAPPQQSVGAGSGHTRTHAAAPHGQSSNQLGRANPAGLPGNANQHPHAALPPILSSSRPTDLFYAHLLPALRAEGLPAMVPRKQWPASVLRKVLTQLCQASPRHLVAQEMWGGCGSAASWWARQRCYTSSLAATSIIGYLIGLGDRHLDNILLDTTSCELVHIDFNVCFEKGLRLRVPEIVPFRMTQAMTAALGAPGGVEGGAFRSAAEVTLGALRARREALVGLLDAVLADPLVDWTSEREGMAARQNLELAVSLSLFVSRLEEVWDVLRQQMDELVPLLDGPGSVMGAYGEVHIFLSGLQARAAQARLRAQSEEVALQDVMAKDAHVMQHLQQLQVTHAASLQDLRNLQQIGAQLYEQCASWTVQHAHVLGLVRDESLPEMSVPSSLWQATEALIPLGLLQALPSQEREVAAPASSTSMLLEALGLDVIADHVPEDLVLKCTELDSQGAALFAEREAAVKRALTIISDYSNVLRVLLPPTYPEQSHHHMWGQALAAMLQATHREGWEQACALIPKDMSLQDATNTWRALSEALRLASAFSSAPPLLTSYAEALLALPASSQPAALEGTPSSTSALSDLAPESVSSAIQDVLTHVSQTGKEVQLRVLAQSVGHVAATAASNLQELVVTEKAPPSDDDAAAIPAPATTLKTDPTALPATHLLHAASTQCHGMLQLLQLMREAGLLQRMQGLSLEDAQISSAAPLADQAEGSGPSSLSSREGVFETQEQVLQHANSVLDVCVVAGSALHGDMLVDLAAHVQVGGSPELTMAVQNAAACCRALDAVVSEAWNVQHLVDEHAPFQAEHDKQCKELHDALHPKQSPQSQALTAGPIPQPISIQQQLHLEGRLRAVHARWQQHHAEKAAELHRRASTAHAAVAAQLQALYLAFMGPCEAAHHLAAADAATLQAGLAALAWLTPTPHPPATVGPALPPLLTLMQQSLPPALSSTWGHTGVHHMMGACSALVFALNASCGTAEQPHVQQQQEAPEQPNPQQSQHKLAFPALLAAWAPRVRAVHALHALLQHCSTEAARVSPTPQTEQPSDSAAPPAETSSRPDAEQSPEIPHNTDPPTQLQALPPTEEDTVSADESGGQMGSQSDGATSTPTTPALLPSLTASALHAILTPLLSTLLPSVVVSLQQLQQHCQSLPWADQAQQQPEGESGDTQGRAVSADTETPESTAGEGSSAAGAPASDPLATLISCVDQAAAAAAAGQHGSAAEGVPDVQRAVALLQGVLRAGMEQEGRQNVAASMGGRLSETIPVLIQHASKHQQLRLRHTTAFGWANEHILMQAVDPAELHWFFTRCTWDPLEPSRKLSSSSRRQLLDALQAACSELPQLDTALAAWLSSSDEAAALVQQAVHKTAPQASDCVQVLKLLLTRRQQWVAAAKDHVLRVMHACSAITQFEVSRQGLVWVPGTTDFPLTAGAFANCAALSQQLGHAFAVLAAQQAGVSEVEAQLAELRRQGAASKQAMALAQKDEAHTSNLFESNLGMLVSGFPDMSANLENLRNTLPSLTQLLCKDVGSMLRELVAITAKQSAAKDVTALASRVLHHHSSTVATLNALIGVLPDMLKQLEVIDAEQASAATEAAAGAQKQGRQKGRATASPSDAASVRRRALAMLLHLEAPTQRLQPFVQNLLEAGPTVQQLLGGIESVSVSASSIAAAIQSEQQVDADSAAVGSAAAEAAAQGTAELAGTSAAEPVVTGPRESLRAFGSSSRHQDARLRLQQRQQQGQQRHARNAHVAWMLRRCILKAEGRDTWDVGALVAGSLKAGSDSSGAEAAGRSGSGGVQVGSIFISSGGSGSKPSPQPSAVPAGMSVAQHVATLVRQASSVDNLCHMYEGWMSWL